MNHPRYKGNPMLRLLECYVLKAIGALSPADADNLASMQPQLSKIYETSGSWDQIIATTMRLPANMPLLILKTWEKNHAISINQGIELSPQTFAEMFVDHNLAPQPKVESRAR